MNQKIEKIKGFVKEHKGKIIAGTAVIGSGAALFILGNYVGKKEVTDRFLNIVHKLELKGPIEMAIESDRLDKWFPEENEKTTLKSFTDLAKDFVDLNENRLDEVITGVLVYTKKSEK